MSLAPCPCGETPTKIYLGGKEDEITYRVVFATAWGSCCDKWMVEFTLNDKGMDSPECMELAIKAWNAAPRGK